MKTIRRISITLAGAVLAGGMAFGAAAVSPEDSALALEKKIRRELVTLPFYSIFDNMSYRVDGGKVTLMGQVNRPTLKTDAERVVMRIAGITAVDNQIEVLPLSPYDDRLRLAVTRAVYGHSVLNRYALGANPSIHIIVKNGNVTLEGVVATEMDSNVAFIQANGVAGAFAVTNNLRVENKPAV